MLIGDLQLKDNLPKARAVFNQSGCHKKHSLLQKCFALLGV
jgi:hypothetical protein